MASSGNLLDYGIAVNFFGNYRNEGSAINNLTNKLNSSLMSLQQMVIGGGITAGLYSLSNAILSTAKSMEQNFANLKSTLGSTAKALETLEWARQKGASTPFEITEVNDAVGTMTSMGFNKNDKMREEVFNSVGDFSALKGFNFADMMQRVSKATFGNWESLGDQFGVRKQTIGTMARERMARTPEKFKGEEADISKAIQMVEKGKQGTEEYKMAVVKLIGVLGRGGMENRLQTIAGAWSNVNDLMSNFMMKMVGYSQIQGSLANAIKETIVNKVLKPFTDAHTVVVNGIKQQTTAVDQLGRIGKGVGDILTQMWSGVDSVIGNATSSIVGWIDKMDAFFSDYKNNVAPLILFLYLVRLQVMDFLSAFWGGFEPVFKGFVKLGLGVYKILGDIAMAMGLGDTKAEALGRTLGIIMGILLGIKAFKLITSPLQSLWYSGVDIKEKLTTIKNLIFQEGNWKVKESILNSWGTLKGKIGDVIGSLKNAIVSSAKFGWTMLQNVAKSIASATVATGKFIYKLAIQSAIMIGSALTSVGAYALAVGTVLWGAIVSATVAVWSFTVALLANPITWIVIGVVALIAAIVYLITHWDEVKKVFIKVWHWIVTGLKDMWAWVKSVGKKIGDWFSKIWEDVKTAFKNAWVGIKQIFADLWDGISAWFMGKVHAFVSIFTDAWASVKDTLGFGDDEATIEVNKNTTMTQVEPSLYSPNTFPTNGQTTTNTVGAINIYPKEGQSSKAIADNVIEKMQNSKSRQ